ncbi:MAG TPA: hypothetical protein VFE05_10990 [Longimicrobiaceae bacterium]|jgi:hypothetical protein|nr:hypothetical protein [Longimicrobiaceae bacterium]
MPERYLGRLTAPLPGRSQMVRSAAGLGLAVWCAVAVTSGWRAIFQVRSVELSATGRELKPGSAVRARIVTSGRAFAHLEVALVQGAHRELLASRLVPHNADPPGDPRPQHLSLEVVLAPEVLARLQPGPAKLRAVGIGSSQWFRVPPPTVRELRVEIAASPRRPLSDR